jgi:hypothetical protein
MNSIFLSHSLREYRLAKYKIEKLKAFYAAQAGLNTVQYWLARGVFYENFKDWQPIIKSEPEVQWRAEIALEAGSLIITSYGKKSQKNEKLSQELVLKTPPRLNKAIITQQKLKKENIHAEIKGGIQFVFSLPQFQDYSFREIFSKCLQELTDPAELPQFPDSYWDERKVPNLKALQKIYILGDLTIEGGFYHNPWLLSGPAKIISSGDIRVSEDVLVNRITFIAQGNITIEDRAQVYNSLLFSQGWITLSERAQVSGKLLSQQGVIVRDMARVLPYSVIYVNGKARARSHPPVSVILRDQSAIYATVILPLHQKGASIIIKDATVWGILYTPEINFQGKLYGVLIAKKFSFGKVTGKITRPALPQTFPVPLGFKANLTLLQPISWRKD